MATSDDWTPEQYAARQRSLIERAQQLLAAQLAAESAGSPDQTVELMLQLIGQWANAVAELALAWYQHLREAAGVSKPFRPKPYDAFDAGSIARDTRWALGQEDPAAALGRVADQHIAQAGKETISRNAEVDPAGARWARMPIGPTCAWCLMLASRGAAYASRRTAEYSADGNKYHPNDDCTPVPVWSDADLPYDANALYEIYLDARKKAGGDPNAIAAQIRRDHWDQVTDGVVPDPKPEDFYDRFARPEYWNRRLQALGIDYGVDAPHVRPEEIITAERLLARGDRLVPIPVDHDQLTPTSDYDWTDHETGETVRVEVKSLRDSTVLHNATFPIRVKRAVGRSMKHGQEFRKRTFLLDAGDRTVPEDVLADLRSYNRDNPNARVLRFFLLARGRITQVVPE